jgi:ribosomal protein S12 methylthiotransferase
VISGERLARFVGRDVDVLVDRLDEEEGTKVGRVQWQADDVDGVTYLERGGWALPGGFVRARITASEDYDFQAAALT